MFMCTQIPCSLNSGGFTSMHAVGRGARLGAVPCVANLHCVLCGPAPHAPVQHSILWVLFDGLGVQGCCFQVVFGLEGLIPLWGEGWAGGCWAGEAICVPDRRHGCPDHCFISPHMICSAQVPSKALCLPAWSLKLPIARCARAPPRCKLSFDYVCCSS